MTFRNMLSCTLNRPACTRTIIWCHWGLSCAERVPENPGQSNVADPLIVEHRMGNSQGPRLSRVLTRPGHRLKRFAARDTRWYGHPQCVGGEW